MQVIKCIQYFNFLFSALGIRLFILECLNEIFVNIWIRTTHTHHSRCEREKAATAARMRQMKCRTTLFVWRMLRVMASSN